jgi:hypothetical protein
MQILQDGASIAREYATMDIYPVNIIHSFQRNDDFVVQGCGASA